MRKRIAKLIQFRITVLRDFEGNVHFVPNGQITVTSNFTNLYAQPVLDVGIAVEEAAQAVTPPDGIEFTMFVVENVSLPPEVEAAIDVSPA